MMTKPPMNRFILATSIAILVLSAVAHGQSIARVNASPHAPTASDDAARAINSLKRLQQDVIVYRSLGEFEDGLKLARVPLRTFETELTEVTGELEDLLVRMPSGKLKIQITNSLACYRDGAFWWRKIDQPRVISVAELSYAEREVSPANQALLSSIPYTVAVNWRLASRYLNQAERTLSK
jgi:hypothetical protein